MRLLLVEDDQILGDGIRAGLKQTGFSVDWVQDGESARDTLTSSHSYQLVILDLGLPRLSGLEVLKALREAGNAVPVLILTARDAITDRIVGLDSGADDYLIKPIDLNELAARVRALLRRSMGRAAPVLKHGDLILDPAAHRVSLGGKDVELSPREFTVLQLLLENEGRVLTRESLEEAVYGWNEEPESNAIEVHVHHLRKKLSGELIRTIRGVGYLIEKETQ